MAATLGTKQELSELLLCCSCTFPHEIGRLSWQAKSLSRLGLGEYVESPIMGVFKDHAITGSKSRDNRPALDNLLKDANRRKFVLVAAWSIDRLGRALQNLLEFLGEIHALGIDLYLHQQGINTTKPAGKAMFQLCGVFAEFERSIIRERINAGLARAKANGKQLGRPKVDRGLRRQFRLL